MTSSELLSLVIVQINLNFFLNGTKASEGGGFRCENKIKWKIVPLQHTDISFKAPSIFGLPGYCSAVTGGKTLLPMP